MCNRPVSLQSSLEKPEANPSVVLAGLSENITNIIKDFGLPKTYNKNKESFDSFCKMVGKCPSPPLRTYVVEPMN